MSKIYVQQALSRPVALFYTYLQSTKEESFDRIPKKCFLINQEPRRKRTGYESRFAPECQIRTASPKASPQSGREYIPYLIQRKSEQFKVNLMSQNEENGKPRADWKSLLPLLVGIVAFLTAVMTLLNTFFDNKGVDLIQEIVKRIPTSSPSPTARTSSGAPISPSSLTSSPNKSNELLAIITQQQETFVDHPFGDKDLDEFNSKKTVYEITNNLKQEKNFQDVVSAIGQLPPSERQALLTKGSKIYKKTWEELDLIPGRNTQEDAKGQTVAGQNAEKQIAKAIVNLVNAMLRQP